MVRVVKADEEASRAHADASKAHKTLRQLEVDVDALRLVSFYMPSQLLHSSTLNQPSHTCKLYACDYVNDVCKHMAP